MNLQRLFFPLLAAASIANASDWYCTNSVDLQTALTNTAIQPGDNVWLMSGTYLAYLSNNPYGDYGLDTNAVQNTTNDACWTFGLNTAAYTNSNLYVTFQSATNQWAKIDREWHDNWAATKNGYVQFKNLEFFDSLKGHHPTNYCCGGGYTGGPWTGFSFKFTAGVQFVNCIVHDMHSFGGGLNMMVRGCIVWNIGVDSVEHVFYPSPPVVTGNIFGWTVNDVFEHLNSTNTIISNNIIFGSGQTSTNTPGIDAKLDSGSVQFNNNYIYNYFTHTPVAGWPNGVGFSGAGYAIISNNVFCGDQPFIQNGSYTNVVFSGNAVVMNITAKASQLPVLRMNTNLIQVVDHNQFFMLNTNFAAEYIIPNYPIYGTFTQWRSAAGWDSHSTASLTLPTNMVYVLPNQDQSKRCHIAVYNWGNSNNVSVSLSGVLVAGDNYQLYNAQDYGLGPIQSGTYNGTSITVPMTNLTTAPILYGTNWGLNQAPPMSPKFGAFVVIHFLEAPQNMGILPEPL